jgi:hypothetical protein
MQLGTKGLCVPYLIIGEMMTSRLLTVAAVAALALFGTHRDAMAQELNNNAALEHAVLGGQDIHVVLDLSRCTAQGTGKPGPAIRGSLHPDAFMVLPDHTIAFSATHFTVRPDKTAVLEFNAFRVQPGGRVTLNSMFLSPANYTVLHQAQFDCEIGNGVTFDKSN